MADSEKPHSNGQPEHQTPLDEEIAGNSTTTLSKAPFEVARDGENSSNEAVSKSGLGLADDASVSVNTSALSSFFSVDKERMEEMSVEVQRALMAKFREFQSLKSDKDVLAMGLEQAKRSSAKKQDTLKTELKGLRTTNLELQQKVASLEGETLKLQAELAEKTNSGVADKTHLQEINSKIAALTEDKKSALELFSKKQNEVTSLNQELDQLRESNKSLRKSVMASQVENEKLSSETIRAKFEKSNLQQELDLVKTNLSWYKEELDRKVEELRQVREERRSQVTKLQSKLEQTTIELSAATSKYEHILTKYNKTSKSLDEALDKLKKATDKQALLEEDFSREMSAKDRTVASLKSSNDVRQKRIQQLESLVETARSSTAKDVAELKAELEGAQEKLVVSESKIHELQETVVNLTHPDLSVDQSVLGASFVSQTNTSSGGVSLTQLLADFQLVKRQLLNERRLKEKLQSQVDDFVQELSRNVPVIEATKERCQVLEIELGELSMLLESANQDKDRTESENRLLKKKLEEKEETIVKLEKVRLDLGAQLSTVLIQMTLRNENSPRLTAEEEQLVNNMARHIRTDTALYETDTEKIISERLVKFKDIVELTKNNEELLAITRSLGVELEKQEKENRSKAEAMESEALDEAKEAILTLREDLEQAERRLKLVTSERDMLKSMTASRKSLVYNESVTERTIDDSLQPSLQSRLDKCQEDFDKFRKESNKTIADLTAKNAELTDLKFKLSMEVSHLESSSKLMEERHKSLQETLQYTKSTNDELSKQLARLQTNLERTDAENQRITDELQDLKSKGARTEAELANAKSESKFLKTLNERLSKENNDLVDERRKLSDVVSNMQHRENELELSHAESKKRTQITVSSLEKELDTLKDKADKAAEDLRNVMLSKESEAAGYQERIDLLREDLSRAREQLAAKTTSVAHLEDTVQRLTKQLGEAETKLATLLNVEAADGSPEGEIARLKEQLSATLDDLDNSRRDCEQFKEVSAAAEKNLAELTSSFDSYRADVEEKVAHLEKQVSELQSQLDASKASVEALQKEKSEVQAELETKIGNYTVQITSLESRVQTADAIREDYNKKVAAIQEEMKSQAKIASDAQQSYEQELQKHAEVARANTSLREELSALKGKLGEFESTAQAAKESLVVAQQGWESQKAQLEDQLREATLRVSEVSEQNSLLLNQLQTASAASGTVEAPEGLGVSDDLSEVISFLRREKEISDSRLLVAVEEEKRLRQKLSLTTAELETVKNELANAHAALSKANELSKNEAEVQEKLYQLNILRESNTTLRNESIKHSERIKALEKQLEEAEKKLQPLEAQSAQLAAELKVKDEEIRVRGEQVEHWKRRADEILNSYDRDTGAETEVALAKKTEEHAALQERFNKLRTESQNKLNQSKTRIKSLLEQSEKLEAAVKEAEKEKERVEVELKAAKEAAEKPELEAQNKQLEQTVQELNAKLEKQSAEAPSAETIEKLKQDLEKSKAEEVEKLVAEKVQELKTAEVPAEAVEEIRRKLEADYEAKLEEHKSKIRVLSGEKVNAVAEKRVEATKAELEQKYKDQIAELETKLQSALAEKQNGGDPEQFAKEKQELLAKFESEKEALKSDIEAKVRKAAEMKEKLLLRRVENLTREKNELLKDKPAAPVPASLPNVPAKPMFLPPAAAPETSPKRSASEAAEQTEKRQKTEEN